MPSRDSPNNTPKNDKPAGGNGQKESKGFWKRKFTGGNAGKSIKDGFSLAKLVAFLLLAVAIISFVHGAESPPTLKSFLEMLRNVPKLSLTALNIPKLDIGTGVVYNTIEKALNAVVKFINLGNIGAVSIYNLLVTLWYILGYLTIF
jgi:hypothetical protein